MLLFNRAGGCTWKKQTGHWNTPNVLTWQGFGGKHNIKFALVLDHYHINMTYNLYNDKWKVLSAQAKLQQENKITKIDLYIVQV